jgi:hypothetical protein
LSREIKKERFERESTLAIFMRLIGIKYQLHNLGDYDPFWIFHVLQRVGTKARAYIILWNKHGLVFLSSLSGILSIRNSRNKLYTFKGLRVALDCRNGKKRRRLCCIWSGLEIHKLAIESPHQYLTWRVQPISAQCLFFMDILLKNLEKMQRSEWPLCQGWQNAAIKLCFNGFFPLARVCSGTSAYEFGTLSNPIFFKLFFFFFPRTSARNGNSSYYLFIPVQKIF